MIRDMLGSILLTEGRREMLAYAQHHNLILNTAIKNILQTDPSPSRKYSMTMLKWVINDLLKIKSGEPTDRRYYSVDLTQDIPYPVTYYNIQYLTQYLLKFDRLNGKAFNKNFQEFKTSKEFISFIKEYPDKHISKRQYKLIAKNPDNVKKIFENDQCIIVLIKKFEASCIYGANTKWCITSHSTTFNGYNSQFAIYYILNKTVPSTHPMSKIAALTELEDTTDDGMDHILVYDATDDLIFSNLPEQDVPADDDRGSREYQIEEYMDNYFIDFEKYCEETLKFDYHEIIVPQPKAID